MQSYILRLLLVSIASTYLLSPTGAQSVQLRDAITQQPIEGCSYHSQLQQGQLPKPFLPAMPVQAFPLTISHINYQSLVLSHAHWQAAQALGYLLLQPEEEKHLNPVTVVALRQKGNGARTTLNSTAWIQHDPGAVLQQIAGFSAIRKGGSYAADPVFRGFKLEQLTILNDGGLTAHAACPNRMDPPTSQIMINQVAEIEVLKGPHSFRYGPSVGGIVNFKSADPAFSATPAAFGRVNSGYETNGQVLRSEAVAGVRTQKTEIAALGSYSQGGNYQSGNGTEIPSAFSRVAGGVQGAFAPAKGHLITASAIRNAARDTRFPTLNMDLLTDDTWMLQAAYRQQPTGRWYKTWHTQVYASLVEHTMGNRLRPASAQMLSHVDAHSRTYGGRTEFTIQKGSLRAFTGADVKYEMADGYRTRNMLQGPMAGKLFTDTLWQQAEQWRGGVFADAQLKTGKFNLVFAGRADRVQGRAANPTAKFEQMQPGDAPAQLNISLSGGVHRQWSTAFSTALWIGRGVRSASLTERFIHFLPVGADPYEMLGQAQLRAEKNNQVDLQMVWGNQKSRLDGNVFYSVVQDFITSTIDNTIKPQIASAPGVRRYMNVPEARRWGFEAAWTQAYTPYLQHQVWISYVHATDVKLQQPLPEIAPLELRYRLEGKIVKNKLQPFGMWRYVAAQNRIAPAFGEKNTPSFNTLDIGLGYLPSTHWQLTFTLHNATDVNYREHLNRYIAPQLPLWAPGRNAVIMVMYKW